MNEARHDKSKPDEALVTRFWTTCWAAVLAAGNAESQEATTAWSRLCKSYWFPVYAFIRKRGHSPEDAQDLTQEFFARFLEKNHISRATKERGRFRVFLMTSVQNFLHNERDRAHAIKRGGGCKFLSLDHQDPEERYRLEPVTETDPAQAFEQRWAAVLLETVLNRLREDFASEGRGPLFEKLQAHLWGDSESIPYSQLAEEFGLTSANIKTIAHRSRLRYREVLREEIAYTVSAPGEIDDEIRYLMQVVSR